MFNPKTVLLSIDPSVKTRLDSLTDEQIATEYQKVVSLLSHINVAPEQRTDASRNPRLVKTRIRNKNGQMQTVYVLPNSAREKSSKGGLGVAAGIGLGVAGLGVLGLAALNRQKEPPTPSASPRPADPNRYKNLPTAALSAAAILGGAAAIKSRTGGSRENRVIQEPLLPSANPPLAGLPPAPPPSRPPSTDPWDTPAQEPPVIDPIGTGTATTPDPWGKPAVPPASSLPPVELRGLPPLEAPPIAKPAKLGRKSPAKVDKVRGKVDKPKTKVDKNLNQTEILARKGETFALRAQLIDRAKENVSKFVADSAAVESWEKSLNQIDNPIAPSYFKTTAPQVAAAKKKAKSLLAELDSLAVRLEGKRTRKNATESFQEELQKVQEHAAKVLTDSSEASKHPQLEKLRAASDKIAAVAVGFDEIDKMRAQVQQITDRLGKLPDRKSQLAPDILQRVNTAERVAKNTGDLPNRIAQYQEKQIDLATKAEAEIKKAQDLTAKYEVEAEYSKVSVQPIIERELGSIEKNMGLMQKMAGPEGIAWVTSKSSAPPDVALALNSDKDLSVKNIKTLSEAAEFRDHVLAVLHGRINGSVELMDRTIAYNDNLHNSAVNGVRESLTRLKKIRDESFSQFSQEEKLIQDVRSIGQDMSFPAGTGVKQPYAEKATSLIQDLTTFRESRAASLNDAIKSLEALESSYESRPYDQYEITPPRKKTPIVLESQKIRALFEASQSIALELRRPVEIQGQIVDTPERIQEVTQRAERKAELNLANKEINRIKKELARINLQVNRQKEAAARGERRVRSTERLEAERKALFEQLRQVVDRTYPPEIRQDPERKDELERRDLRQQRGGLIAREITNKQGERQKVWIRPDAPRTQPAKVKIRGFFKSPDPLADKYNPRSEFAAQDDDLRGYSAVSAPDGLSMNSVVFLGKDAPSEKRAAVLDDLRTISEYQREISELKNASLYGKLSPQSTQRMATLGQAIAAVKSKIGSSDWDKVVKTQDINSAHSEVWTTKIANDNGIPGQTSKFLSPSQTASLIGSAPFNTYSTLHDRVPGTTLQGSSVLPREWKRGTGDIHHIFAQHEDLAKINAFDDFILNNDRNSRNLMHDADNNRYYSIDTGIAGGYNTDAIYSRTKGLKEEMAKLKAPWELRNLKTYADTLESLLDKYSPDDIVEQQRKVAQDMGEINWFYRTHLPLSKEVIDANHARNRENVQMIREFLAARGKK